MMTALNGTHPAEVVSKLCQGNKHVKVSCTAYYLNEKKSLDLFKSQRKFHCRKVI